MSNEVDYYDVQSMIRDERSSVRAEITDTVREAKAQLRAEIEQATQELQEEIASLQRTMNARTGHLT